MPCCRSTARSAFDWPTRRGLALWLAGPGTSAVELHGVDLCSGVRNDGRLDGARLADFFDVLPKP